MSDESRQPIHGNDDHERLGTEHRQGRVDFPVGDDSVRESVLAGGRPWLGIHFECCNVYTRVYKNKPGTAYVGWCPQCSRRVRLPIGPDGTGARFFSAS